MSSSDESIDDREPDLTPGASSASGSSASGAPAPGGRADPSGPDDVDRHLAAVRALPLRDHPERYEAMHTALRDTLSTIDET